MKQDIHQHAYRLIDTQFVEGLEGMDAAERARLESHWAECAECQARMRATNLALQALRQNTVMVDPALVGTTQARVRLRGRELRANQLRMRTLWIACGLSWLMGAITAPLLWQAMAWLGRHFELSPAIWITGFAMFWLAPATLVGALVAWRHSHAATLPEVWER